MSSSELELELACEILAEPALPEELVRVLVAATLLSAGVVDGIVELGVHFVGPPRMRELNSEHREVDAATDVLSFPIDGLDPLAEGLPRQLGDVVVCGPYVAEQSLQGATLAHSEGRDDESLDIALSRCVVHGVLHLCGFDHELGEAAALEMFELEQQILDAVRVLTEPGP